jgi:hypothetical protein
MRPTAAGAGGEGRAGHPDGDAARRLRRLRRASIAGALATLGVFSGLAAAGDPERGSPSAPPASPEPAAQPGSWASPAQDGDPGRDGGYFDPWDGSQLAPGTPAGPPDAVSGAS